ncbi:cytochrome P450 [Streptomyces sp. NPDC003006]
MRSVPAARGGIPLLGHGLSVVHDPMAFIASLGSVGGGLVEVRIGTSPFYFVTAYEAAYEVLVEHARSFDKGRMFRKARPLIGNGLLTSDGALHRSQRRLVQPAFQADRMAAYSNVMIRRAYELAGSWQPGQTIQLDQALYRLPMAVVAEALFGEDLARPVVAEIEQSLPVILKGIPPRAFLPDALGALPIPVNRRFDRTVLRLRRAIDLAVAQHETAASGDAHLLTTMRSAQSRETGESMSDQQIRDEIVTLLLAGTETTATTLAWTFHALSCHSEVEARLHSELDSMLGDRQIRFEDVRKLEYTSRILSEVTRLYSALMVMRTVTVPVTVAGHALPPGAELVVCPYVIHRDPRFFADPHRFDPDRWHPDRVGALPRDAFLPFSLGKHKCIGDYFAWTEMVTIIAALCSRWRFLPPPRHKVKEVLAVLPRVSSLPMTIEAR